MRVLLLLSTLMAAAVAAPLVEEATKLIVEPVTESTYAEAAPAPVMTDAAETEMVAPEVLEEAFPAKEVAVLSETKDIPILAIFVSPDPAEKTPTVETSGPVEVIAPIAQETPVLVEEAPAEEIAIPIVEETLASETPVLPEEPSIIVEEDIAIVEDTPVLVVKTNSLTEEIVAPVEETPVIPEANIIDETPVLNEEHAVIQEETPAPVEETPAPVEETPVPVEETPAPMGETTSPVEETPSPVEETAIPGEETPIAVEETTAPEEETPSLIDETAAPIEETTTPVEETLVEEAPVLVEETAVPVEETAVPVEETAVPVEETAVPVEETAVPVEETAVPVNETPVPVDTTTVMHAGNQFTLGDAIQPSPSASEVSQLVATSPQVLSLGAPNFHQISFQAPHQQQHFSAPASHHFAHTGQLTRNFQHGQAPVAPVNPLRLVPAQFRAFIYPNDAPDVLAAKINFFQHFSSRVPQRHTFG